MNYEELFNIVNKGENPNVRMISNNDGNDIDVGMKGKIIKIEEDYDDNDVLIISIDMSEFEEENIKHMKNDWYDDCWIPCLKWIETIYYPEDKIHLLYVMKDEKCEFEII